MNERRVYNYRPLFGHYFLEIQKFFAMFTVSGIDQDQNQIKPIVIMGTPQAAFRKINAVNTNISSTNPSSINSSANLPVINFIAMDFRRIYGMENPYVRTYDRRRTTDPFGRERITYTNSPQSWEITFQVSVWTDSYKQRDDLMSKILTTFQHDVGLRFYPDPLKDPEFFLWVELRMEENFSDETNLEDLQEKESRKIIRSSFTMVGRAILIYDTNYVPTILRIQIENEILAKTGKYLTFSLDEVNGEEIIILS